MHLLALETATTVCSVALGDETSLLSESNLFIPRKHSERLPLLIQEVLAHADVPVRGLDAVAISAGPGSYTGLRIGVSTAKGLAFAHGLPLIAIPTLEALAASLLPLTRPGDRVVAALDARRREVYLAVYEVVAPSRPDGLRKIFGEAALPLKTLPEHLTVHTGGTWWLVGDAGQAVAEVLAPPSARVLPFTYWPPLARHVLSLARLRFAEGAFADLATFEPLYLRPFTARKGRSPFEKLPPT